MTREYLNRRLREKTPKAILLLAEMIQYWLRLCKYNASFRTDRDFRKMQYTLLRENHTIEKGMSIKNTKHGYGKQKVEHLLQRLSVYNNKYGKEDRDFLLYPLSTIKTYLLFQKQENVDITDIEIQFHSLCKETGIDETNLILPAGVSYVKAETLKSDAQGDFEKLLYSRHSIRYFTDEFPSREQLTKALELASRTPSACNRQAWHTHVFFGDQCHELLRMQGGCNGFHDDVHCAIVVTADMKGFLHFEPFQCFIDGGLYAMNLINALHYAGLGTIPLSCGFYQNKLKRIHKTFGIPENEVLVVIIGTGVLDETVKIAESTRKNIRQTNVWHN